MTTCMGKSCSFGLLCSPVNLYLYQQLIAKELFSAKAYTSYASKRSVKNLEIYVLSKCLISPVNYKKNSSKKDSTNGSPYIRSISSKSIYLCLSH